MRSGFVHDKLRNAPVTIFGDTCSTAKNDQAFQFTNLSLSKCRADRLIKSAEISSLVEVKMENLDITASQMLFIKSKLQITSV